MYNLGIGQVVVQKVLQNESATKDDVPSRRVWWA